MTELWRLSLDRLREQFDDASKRFAPLRCRLWHTENGEAHRLIESPPKLRAKDKLVYLGLSDYGSTKADRSVLIDGDAQAEVVFKDYAQRAGRLLSQSPASSPPSVPAETLQTKDDLYRWLWFVFDCAWCALHPTLTAERKLWFKPTKPLPDIDSPVVWFPYDVEQLRALVSLRVPFPPALDFPKAWGKKLPGFYFSELPNFFTASVDALDVLAQPGPPPKGSKGTRKKTKRRRKTTLTKQENAVKQCLDLKMSNKTIANQFNVTPGRVSQITKSIKEKEKQETSRSVNLARAKTVHENVTNDETPALRTPRQRK